MHLWQFQIVCVYLLLLFILIIYYYLKDMSHHKDNNGTIYAEHDLALAFNWANINEVSKEHQ